MDALKAYREAVRAAAAAIPRRLKDLRGRLMLERASEVLGVEEVHCPACRGGGWLDLEALEVCPVCCGFREVPRVLAEWVEARVRRLLEPPPAWAEPSPVLRDRPGRLAEMPCRVHLPEGSQLPEV